MCKFFNSYEESLHFGVCKFAKYVRNCVVFWKNLHSWQKFYTTAGRDGRDKFQVCQPVQLHHWPFSSNKHLEGLKSKYWPLILSRNVNVKYGFCPNLLALNQLFGTMSLFFIVQQKPPCSSVYKIGTTDFHFLFLIGATNFPFLVEAADSMKLPLCQGQLTDRAARYIVNQQSQSFKTA